MDNRTIDIVSEGLDELGLALSLIWPNAPGGNASHHRIIKCRKEVDYHLGENGVCTHHTSRLVEDDGGVPTLILLWSEEGASLELPFPMDLEGATQFIQQWLKQVDYGQEPDHDGSNDKGWRVFTESWGHVAGHHYAIVAIQPAWAMYGK